MTNLKFSEHILKNLVIKAYVLDKMRIFFF